MIRSFVKLQNLDLGFDPVNVLTAQVFLPGNLSRAGAVRAGEAGVRLAVEGAVFYSQLMESLKNTAGIESIGAVSAAAESGRD